MNQIPWEWTHLESDMALFRLRLQFLSNNSGLKEKPFFKISNHIQLLLPPSFTHTTTSDVDIYQCIIVIVCVSPAPSHLVFPTNWSTISCHCVMMLSTTTWQWQEAGSTVGTRRWGKEVVGGQVEDLMENVSEAFCAFMTKAFCVSTCPRFLSLDFFSSPFRHSELLTCHAGAIIVHRDHSNTIWLVLDWLQYDVTHRTLNTWSWCTPARYFLGFSCDQ